MVLQSGTEMKPPPNKILISPKSYANQNASRTGNTKKGSTSTQKIVPPTVRKVPTSKSGSTLTQDFTEELVENYGLSETTTSDTTRSNITPRTKRAWDTTLQPSCYKKMGKTQN